MADANTPFVDPNQERVAQPATPEEQQNIAGQWASFMEKPGARAALLNFGISMMQPPSFGDNFTSQFGRAVGSGAEAAQRGELQEANVEKTLAQSEAAVARAGKAKSDVSLEAFRQRSLNERQQRAIDMQLRKTYTTDMAQIRKINDKRESDAKLMGGTPQLIKEPTYEEWFNQRAASLIPSIKADVAAAAADAGLPRRGSE